MVPTRRMLVPLMILLGSFPGRASTVPHLDATRLSRAASSRGSVVLSLPGAGSVSFRVEPRVLAGTGVRSTMTTRDGRFVDVDVPDVTTVVGSASGPDVGWARLTVAPGFLEGVVRLGDRAWVVEGDGTIVSAPATRSARISLHDDVVPGPGPPTPEGVEVSAGVRQANCVLQDCGELTARVILDGDASFRAVDPSTCFARQLAALNAVEGIFASNGLGIRFEVSHQNCRTADLAPVGTAPRDLHLALRDAWTDRGNDRSLVHLFVGYDFGRDQALGMAYEPGVCPRVSPDPFVVGPPAQRCSHGYSLHQAVARPDRGYDAGPLVQAKLMAHEFGHAFHATHEEAEGCRRSAPRTGTLMCPYIQEDGPDRFSADNAERIRSHAEATIGYVARVP